MKQIKMLIEKDYISFRDKYNDIVYDFRRDKLAKTLDLPDGKISEWIYDLSGIRWATKEMLWRLRDLIKEEFPDNDIDWEATEWFIQSRDY